MFNNDEIVTEITETEAVTHLTAVQVRIEGFNLGNRCFKYCMYIVQCWMEVTHTGKYPVIIFF